MPQFTYEEVTAQVKRLGLTYATDDMFTEEEIAVRMETLADYELTTKVASLTAKNISADTLTAFAQLAGTLGATVTTEYSGLEIVRDTTPAERRDAAVMHLKAAHNEANRETARQSLAFTDSGWIS